MTLPVTLAIAQRLSAGPTMIIAGGRSKVWARSRSVPSNHPCQGAPALASAKPGLPRLAGPRGAGSVRAERLAVDGGRLLEEHDQDQAEQDRDHRQLEAGAERQD